MEKSSYISDTLYYSCILIPQLTKLTCIILLKLLNSHMSLYTAGKKLSIYYVQLVAHV